MKDFKDYIDLGLLPFGKGYFQDYTTGTKFFNYDGEETDFIENKLHACAIKHVNESQNLKYISSLMRYHHTDGPFLNFAEECAKMMNLNNFDTIKNCTESGEGILLLKDISHRTDHYEQPLRYVPTITINGVRN